MNGRQIQNISRVSVDMNLMTENVAKDKNKTMISVSVSVRI